MRARSRFVVAIAVGLTLAVGATIAIGAARTKGGSFVTEAPHGPPTFVKDSCQAGTKINYVEETVGANSTTSTTFVDVPNARYRFRVGGSSPSCVIVRFSAEAWSADDTMYVQAVMGAQVALPAGNGFQFVGDDDNFSSAHAIDFIFPSVSPGRRTVKIQYASALGTAVWMHEYSMVIEHR